MSSLFSDILYFELKSYFLSFIGNYCYLEMLISMKHKTEYVFYWFLTVFIAFSRFLSDFQNSIKCWKWRFYNYFWIHKVCYGLEKIVLMRNEFWQRNFSIWTKIEEAVTISLGKFWSWTVDTLYCIKIFCQLITDYYERP